MTDHQALLAAVLAAPDDDAPRLVYADWLDENGEPERAEFIRLGCEISRIWEQKTERLANLLSESGTLLLKHGETWSLKELVRPCGLKVGGQRRWLTSHGIIDRTSVRHEGSYVYPPDRLFSWDWARGFIHSITCTASDWLKHADAITAEHPVREVRLTTWPVMAVWYEEEENQDDPAVAQKAMLRQLAQQWPGITFHLPELQQRSTYEWEAGPERERFYARGELPVLLPRSIIHGPIV